MEFLTMCWTPTGISLALNPSRVSTTLELMKQIKMDETKSIRRHSRTGLVSFGIGIANIFILFKAVSILTKFVLAYSELNNNQIAINGMQNVKFVSENLPILGLFQLLGLGLGIVGLFKTDDKKLFPVLGTALNGLLFTLCVVKLNIFRL